jgi:tRNA(fMet)-specific endonuclease VapC
VTPRFLLDTNIIIAIRRRRPPATLHRLAVLSIGEAVMSPITYGELIFGAEKSQQTQQAFAAIARLAEAVPVLPLDGESTGRHYGRIRADLERRGLPIGGNDLWIAAHALAAGLTLVTANVGEFLRVPGLVVEDWTV